MDAIETLLKDPWSASAKLTVTCKEDFHFVAAIYLDGHLVVSKRGTDLKAVLSQLNDAVKEILDVE